MTAKGKSDMAMAEVAAAGEGSSDSGGSGC